MHAPGSCPFDSGQHASRTIQMVGDANGFEKRTRNPPTACNGRAEKSDWKSHIYLDDIVIWSKSPIEHEQNVRAVLEALRAARLYVNLEKTHLFFTEIDFLGHHISVHVIASDNKEVDRILNWPNQNPPLK